MDIFLKPKTEPYRRLGPPDSDIVFEVEMLADEVKRNQFPWPARALGGTVWFFCMWYAGWDWRLALLLPIALDGLLQLFSRLAVNRSDSGLRKVIVTKDSIWWPSYGKHWLGRPRSEIKSVKAFDEDPEGGSTCRAVLLEFVGTRITTRISLSVENAECLLKALSENGSSQT